MAIIPPRRDQPITGRQGIGTTRLLEYLEQVAVGVNATPVEIEEQIFALEGAIQKAGALTSEIESQISDIVQSIQNFGKLNAQIEELNKRLLDLEQLQ